jgi:hypothetical protein
VESQKAFLERNKTILNRNEALLESNQAMTETIKAQGEEIKALKALLQEGPRPSSCSEVTTNSGTSVGLQSSQTRSISAASSQMRKERPQVQDDGAVPIDMGKTVECTVMKATWLSKIDAKKKLGSMVVWLKSKIDADYLLRVGMAMFDATDALCSPVIVRDNSGPCYHCNRYEHKQSSCTSQIRRAIWSKGHRRDVYPNKDSSKSQACADAHTVFDWACKLHPQHYRHVGQQKAETRQNQRSSAMDVDMHGIAQTDPTNASSVSGRAQVAGTASTSNTPSSSSC